MEDPTNGRDSANLPDFGRETALSDCTYLLWKTEAWRCTSMHCFVGSATQRGRHHLVHGYGNICDVWQLIMPVDIVEPTPPVL